MKVLQSQGGLAPTKRRASLMLDRIELVRRLIPAYVLKGSVLGWQCSVCRKLFLIGTDQALARASSAEPVEVQHEFRQHDCRIQFAAALEGFDRSRK